MASIERLKEDIKTLLKSGDSFQVGVLRMLLSELQNKEKEKFARLDSAARFAVASARRARQAKSKTALDESETISVLQREAKKRKEAIGLFEKGGRDDLVQKEKNELAVIEEYLPRQLSVEDVSARVEKLIGQGFGDFNGLIKEAMKELKGKVDGARLAEIIKEKLK
ncbi:MAG: GatB/YqeY domain-containing protein [Candidatus Liptonbacteria bacterium]|nr:GatB/YqeY domain-containing protein [Candidatus Liptonbacteria bacterium]